MELTESLKNLPLTEAGVIGFLASPMVDGIGRVYARRLVERFGKDAIQILMEHPEEAESVPGIGKNRVAAAAESLKRIAWPVNLLVFLHSCGVSEIFIGRIFSKYRKRAADIILEDPYSMVEDVWQLSFFTADKIGRELGIESDDPRRIRGALVTAVKHYASSGHLFATESEAVNLAAKLAAVEPEKVGRELATVIDSGRIVGSKGGLYLPVFYKAEKEAAEYLSKLAKTRLPEIDPGVIPEEDVYGHPYTPTQINAIEKGLHSPVMVLTGGPGTGKTTVLRGIIESLEKQGKKVILAAPTGRAAKRMSMLTEREASTIHRLLGYRDGQGYRHKKIEADALIIDEGSMMEQVLFNHLLQNLQPGTRVMLVGDVNQLPAIGAGDVLRDMIKSGVIPVVELDENFRQSEGSLIASGAHSINEGRIPESDSLRDFMIIPEPTVKAIHDKIIDLMAKELPATHGISPADIIVVTPQQIGPLGARQLNIDLQEAINPVGPELRRGETILRLGDPVMQTANSRERRVYNGETGRITAVNTEERTLEVTFADGQKSIYRQREQSELVLAYATTVHKLQGSEVPYMIFPITMAHKPMLYRNLLYTGVSRATKLCVLVGEEEAIAYAVGNVVSEKRNSNFHSRLAKAKDHSD